MVTARSWRSRLVGAMAVVSAAALAVAGCSSSEENGGSAGSGSDTSASQDNWPRTFENADGTTTEIPQKPEQIVSTSVSVTGTLLAFDAPVIGSGSAGNGNFFAQWASVAEERGVENIWSAGSVDLEILYEIEPDLIIVSLSGADSVTDSVADLQEIAPTIIVDYGGQTWQELAAELGEATGLEDEAAKTVADFDTYVQDAASSIEVPEGSANIISFNGPGDDNPIARAGSAQAQLLTQLGFTLEDPPVEWHSQPQERADFVWAQYENLTELTAETTFILSQEDDGAQGFADDPVLANLPSVQAGQVYGLGKNSFRVDLFSATEIVDAVVANFSK